MDHKDMQQRVTNAVRLLTPVVWEAQSHAVASAFTRCHGLPHQTYPSLRPMMVRPCFREYLVSTDLPDGWSIGGDPTKMVEIWIQSEGLRLRYLKERRATYPGGVPAAGHSEARKAYWAPTLFDTQRSDIDDDVMNLLLLWDMHSPFEDESFVMRVVHTVGTGAWGRETPIDLSVDLSPSLGLEKHLRFNDDPQDTDFFADLASDAEEADGGA